VIFQSTSGKLLKEAILRSMTEKKTNLPFQKTIVPEILWIPMRIRIDE